MRALARKTGAGNFCRSRCGTSQRRNGVTALGRRSIATTRAAPAGHHLGLVVCRPLHCKPRAGVVELVAGLRHLARSRRTGIWFPATSDGFPGAVTIRIVSDHRPVAAPHHWLAGGRRAPAGLHPENAQTMAGRSSVNPSAPGAAVDCSLPLLQDDAVLVGSERVLWNAARPASRSRRRRPVQKCNRGLFACRNFEPSIVGCRSLPSKTVRPSSRIRGRLGSCDIQSARH